MQKTIFFKNSSENKFNIDILPFGDSRFTPLVKYSVNVIEYDVHNIWHTLTYALTLVKIASI